VKDYFCSSVDFLERLQPLHWLQFVSHKIAFIFLFCFIFLFHSLRSATRCWQLIVVRLLRGDSSSFLGVIRLVCQLSDDVDLPPFHFPSNLSLRFSRSQQLIQMGWWNIFYYCPNHSRHRNSCWDHVIRLNNKNDTCLDPCW
jgi:hypothetical protein